MFLPPASAARFHQKTEINTATLHIFLISLDEDTQLVHQFEQMSHLARVTLTVGRKGLLTGESRVVSALPKQILSYRPKTTYTEKLTSLQQYEAEKKAAKDRRTELYDKKVERKEGLKTRQNPEKKNFLKNQFRQWFDNMASKQAYLDREARRQGKEWKINVAAMVERLPIITPDREQWESDYMQLQSELSRYDDIAYPKELGFEDPIDRKIYTEEELLGTFIKIVTYILLMFYK